MFHESRRDMLRSQFDIIKTLELIMVSANNYGRRLGIAILSLVISVQIASAQTFFTTTGKGDLLAGFRKTGGHPENNEFVVRLGQVTKFIGLPIGTTTNITIYGNSQVADAFPDNFGFLQWSVFSTFTEFPGGSNWNTAVGSFPDATCWFTIPRTATNVQSQAPTRQVDANQASLRESMLGIINGATYISGNLGVTNANNNSNLVVEPVISAYSSDILTANMADPGDATIGDFNGNSPYNSENTTPSPFSSPVISDFYQSCPSSTIDPFSGQTNGGAFYLGYFTLNANGTMTFT